jgi:ABC-type enterochelin transport system ATPase subunit
MPAQENEITSKTLKFRYPGIRPFTTEEQSLFFGRNNEIKDLLVIISKSNISVLIGTPGAGKTSLLQAGVVPQLIKNNFIPIVIRFLNFIDDPVLQIASQIRSALSSQMTSETGSDQQNDYCFYLIS